MFDVTLAGVEELLRTFEAAKARVHSLQYTIPREFENWRTEDMHSKYPKPLVTKKRRILRVSQRIYSRGRGSAAKNPRSKRRRRYRHSRRPVLRPDLYEQLKERMINLVEETVQW